MMAIQVFIVVIVLSLGYAIDVSGNDLTASETRVSRYRQSYPVYNSYNNHANNYAHGPTDYKSNAVAYGGHEKTYAPAHGYSQPTYKHGEYKPGEYKPGEYNQQHGFGYVGYNQHHGYGNAGYKQHGYSHEAYPKQNYGYNGYQSGYAKTPNTYEHQKPAYGNEHVVYGYPAYDYKH